ncbi:MAG: hypothetical protein U1F51_18375 [Burkholderiales bacterium]
MRTHQSVRLLVAASFAALAGVAAAQPTTYSYSGTPYVAPTGTFTTSMRITGSFTTANPLPKNMPPTAIGPAGNGAAIAWSFSNGIDTFTQANSSEIYGMNSDFFVGTDNRGNVNYYNIGLVKPLPPHAVNDLVDFFWISKGNAIQALDQASCAMVTANLCTFIPFSGAGTVTENVESGAFAATFVESVPVDSRWALGALAALFAFAGARFVRARPGTGR